MKFSFLIIMGHFIFFMMGHIIHFYLIHYNFILIICYNSAKSLNNFAEFGKIQCKFYLALPLFDLP